MRYNARGQASLLTAQIDCKSISVGSDRHGARLAAADGDGTSRSKDSNLARASDLNSSNSVGPGDMGALHGADDSLSAADGLKSHCKFEI